jgi:hypothetical protein
MFESFNIIEGVLWGLSFGVVHLVFKINAFEHEVNQKIENLKDSNLELRRQINRLS